MNMIWRTFYHFPIILVIHLALIPCIRCRGGGTGGQNESSTLKPGYQYTSYNLGIICDAAQPPFHPKNLKEIQEIVTTALKSGYNIKAIGNLYTATDLICTDGIPVSLSKIKHFKFDSATGSATVGAGATLGYLLRRLHKNGRTLHGIPTFLDITIGGALGTGAFGTSLQNPASISDQVVGLVVVDGLGKVRHLKDLRTIQAFQTNLGLLGIVYEVTFSTIPQYKLHIQNYPQSDSLLNENNELISMAKSSDHFQFFWFPTMKQVVISIGQRLPMSFKGNCQTYLISEGSRFITEPLSKALEAMQDSNNNLGYFTMQSIAKVSLYQKVPGRSPIFTADKKTLCEPAIGYSHRMSGNKCKECPWNNGHTSSLFEFGVGVVIPIEEFGGAVKLMRTILEEYPMELPFGGIHFRFLSSSDGLLTVNSDRVSVAIEWSLVARDDRFGKPMLGLSTTQALLKALVLKHAGRPHWGKNGPIYFQQPYLLKRYPKLKTFIREMEEFDPRGVFMNDFGKRLRFGWTKSSLDSYVKHCGLVDTCICQRDYECGDGGPTSYLCGVIHGYKVCRERGDHFKKFKENFTRKLISLVIKQR